VVAPRGNAIGIFSRADLIPAATVFVYYWFPNVEGGDQFRHFQLQGDRLVLDADTSWGKVRIAWARPSDSQIGAHRSPRKV
jgi:hypothetical protein